MYKVYILDKKIDIATMPFDGEATFGALVFDQAGLNITKMLNILQKNNTIPRISTQKAKQLDQNTYSSLWLVEAAGGVVSNRGELLMIFRNGCWDLPKGKLEKGEKIEDCAIREVSEECGLELELLDRGELITQTMHVYNMYGKNVLKRTWWYQMEYKGCKDLIPQSEEGITEARWLTQEQAAQAVEQSYGTIADVMQEYEKQKTKL